MDKKQQIAFLDELEETHIKNRTRAECDHRFFSNRIVSEKNREKWDEFNNNRAVAKENIDNADIIINIIRKIRDEVEKGELTI